MIRSDRNPSSGEEPPAFSISVLSDELLIEILTRLPGKQIGRCKCVRKPWRSIIGSRYFTETYRKRQRGLLLCWPEEIKRDDRLVGHHLRFFHCPLRRSVEPPEKFSPLRELETWTGLDDTDLPLFVTQLVNGLLCVGEAETLFGSSTNLTVRNICTGEMMRIPKPPYVYSSESTYHLGYDPVNRMYKLLRLIFRTSRGYLGGAQIMDLRPPLDTWRELKFCSAGMCKFTRERLLEERTSPDDGVMCWLQKRHGQQQLLCFDVNKESFCILEHPVAGPELEMLKVEGVTHAITRFNDRLVIWFSSSEDDFSGISCYVQEDDEGKNWRKKRIEFSEALKERGGFVVESGNRPSFSLRGEMLVRNPDQSWRVYSYSRLLNQHIDKEDVLFVGKLPDGAPGLSYTSHLRQWHRFNPGSLSSVFSFSDSTTLYQSLDDVLGAGSAAM